MQLLRPLFVFALMCFTLNYWLWGYPGMYGWIGGMITFWLMLGFGFRYWLGIDWKADKMVFDLMVWKLQKAKERSVSEAAEK